MKGKPLQKIRNHFAKIRKLVISIESQIVLADKQISKFLAEKAIKALKTAKKPAKKSRKKSK